MEYVINVSWEETDGFTDNDQYIVNAENLEDAKKKAIKAATQPERSRFQIDSLYLKII